MSPLRSLLIAAALTVNLTRLSAAFAPPTPFVVRRTIPTTTKSTPLSPLYGVPDKDSGGGAALAKPAIKTAQTTKTATRQKRATKRRVRTSEPISRRDDRDFEDAPLYKVMLIGDDEYDQEHVCDRLCAIIEDMDEGQAATVFKQAMTNGKAMCGKYPFEHAEMYKELLLRSDPMIYSDIEEENDKGGKKKK